MNQKGFAPILIVLIIAAAIVGYLIYSGKINLNKPQLTPSPTTDASQDSETEKQILDQILYTFKFTN